LKYLLIFLVVLAMVFSTGCFIVPEEPEEPEEPIPVMSAEVYGVVWNEAGDVCCYIENTGDIDIKFYELTFDADLLYHKPITPVVVLGENLEVGDTIKVCVEIECPVCGDHDIVSVNVTYELWE